MGFASRLSAVAQAAVVALAATDDTPWPLPADCVPTDPQVAYTRRSDFLTFRDTREVIPNTVRVNLGGNSTSSMPSFLATKYPDPLGLSGEGVTKLRRPTGYAVLDTATGKGHIDVEFDIDAPTDIGRMSYDRGLAGHFRIVSTDFEGWGGYLVPFQRRMANGTERPAPTGGVSGNFIQHGCSDQGEPGFPELRSRVSTWGHGDIFLNGKVIYRNVWLHSMYTERYRDPDGSVYADDAHSAIYSPKECNGKAHYPPEEMEFSLVVARWCQDTNPEKIHAVTDMDMLLSFAVSDD